MNKFYTLENLTQKELNELARERNILQQRINKTIEYIETHKRQDEFLQLNEWETRDLLEILKGDPNERNII